MKKRLNILTLWLIPAVVVAGIYFTRQPTIEKATTLPQISVYKSPYCGCCKKWVSHLQENGFKVTAYNTNNVQQIKQKHGITRELSSCHTAIVNGYIVEGHVPASDIQRLITEKPDIKGITVPGMPVGSPGMEQGNQKDPYKVIAFDKQGNTRVFSEYNQ